LRACPPVRRRGARLAEALGRHAEPDDMSARLWARIGL
jgi:hypothetical protein